MSMTVGMIVLVSTAVYLTGALLLGRHWMADTLEELARKRASERADSADSRPLVNKEDREKAYGPAFWAGVFWPLILLVAGLYALLAESLPPITPPSEQARLDRRELDRIRRLAADNDLDLGETPES